MENKVYITETVLRDAHQSLLATRMRTEDMLPIAEKLDSVGYWSLETWGGATFDACLRYLKESPWERLRRLRAAMPKHGFRCCCAARMWWAIVIIRTISCRHLCSVPLTRASMFFASSMP